MILEIIPSGPFETNAYIVACPVTLQAAIVDPAPQSKDKISEFIKKNKLIVKKILLTHSHWDHIADVSYLKKEFKIPVYIHAEDASNLEHPGSDKLPCWIEIEGVKPDFLMAENDLIEVGKLLFKVIYTPGHTPGGVCFYCEEEKILLSGDTLFKGTIGNLSFPTARPKMMWKSLNKLSLLPKQTKVFPGHGESTTIGAESWLKDAENYFS